ncbi:MAG: hypothetical protein WCP25_06485 [Polynucleobacter sp.]|jgi:hypothetical protein
MVEVIKTHHPLACRLLRLTAYILAGGVLAQAFSCLASYYLIYDSQAAGMLAHLLIQHLSYYFLGGTFVILSLSNVLIKKGLSFLISIRIPSLTLILAIAATSFLLIPRMDYLREAALLDGMPVMLSPFANYFLILNSLTLVFLIVQIALSVLIAWRLSKY